MLGKRGEGGILHRRESDYSSMVGVEEPLYGRERGGEGNRFGLRRGKETLFPDGGR